MKSSRTFKDALLGRPATIGSFFQPVISFQLAPDCETAGCKLKARFGFAAPPALCIGCKLEGMHEISRQELEDFEKNNSCVESAEKSSSTTNDGKGPLPSEPVSAAIATDKSSMIVEVGNEII